jgi:ribosomal protein S27AE
MTPAPQRPSLAELSGRGNLERTCRFCGGSWFRVISTWHLKDGTIARKRVCGRCGQDYFLTDESPRSRTNA